MRKLVFGEKDNTSDPSTSCGNNAINVLAPFGQVSLPGGLPFESGATNPFSSLPKLEVPAKRISPLLDLHADYDENSLPSPTRNNAPPFPMPKHIGFGAFPMLREKLSFQEKVEPTKNSLYPHLNDPLKAVSSYQQKYGQQSEFPCNDLPSPTPSGDECKSTYKVGDIFSEVSSFPVPKTVALPSTSQMPVSQPSTVSSSGISYASGPPGYSKQIEQSTAGPNHTIKAASKSRDPRLRFLNRDSAAATDMNRRAIFSELKDGIVGGASIGSRKHKAVDEPLVDENVLKRFRFGTVNPRDRQSTGNPNNQLMNIRDPANSSCINMKTLQPPQTIAPHVSAAPAVPLPSVLLKDIAVNPTLLMHLIQMEHQKKSASETQLKVTQGVMSSGMTNNGIAGTVFTPCNAPNITEAAQVPSVRPQVPVQSPHLVELFELKAPSIHTCLHHRL